MNGFFGFDQNVDRDMIGMRFGPRTNLLQARCGRLADAPVIEILYVHDLEPRLRHDVVGIEVWVWW